MNISESHSADNHHHAESLTLKSGKANSFRILNPTTRMGTPAAAKSSDLRFQPMIVRAACDSPRSDEATTNSSEKGARTREIMSEIKQMKKRGRALLLAHSNWL